jgi:Zn-dependent protease with chaperone function
MKSFPSMNQEMRVAEQTTLAQVSSDTTKDVTQVMSKKVRGGFFLVLGYLLSPLCWWNDLIFNLPIAYFFGYICSLFSPKLLLPGSIIGYWLSNIVGILLMQAGAMDVFQNQPKERNLKKELLTGFISSTVYTLAILALIQLKILDAPVLFSGS